MKIHTLQSFMVTCFLAIIIAMAPLCVYAKTENATGKPKDNDPQLLSVPCALGVIVLVGGAYVIYKLWGVCNTVLPPNPPPPPPPPPPNTNKVVKVSGMSKQNLEASTTITSAAYLFGFPNRIGTGDLPFCLQCTVSNTSTGTIVGINALQVDAPILYKGNEGLLFEGTGIPSDSYAESLVPYFSSGDTLIPPEESQISFAFPGGVITTTDGSTNSYHKVVLQVSKDMQNWQDVMTFESQYTEHVITGTYGQETVFFRAKLLSGSSLQEL